MLQNKSKRLLKDSCLGTQMPYNYTPDTKVPLPEGYTPFYINYIGRHCGRYLSNKEEAEWICTILGCAYEHKGLTIRGLELLSKIINILELSEKRANYLNPVGEKSLEGIALRMCLNYPSVFGKMITATSTKEFRTQKSRDLFLKELSHHVDVTKVQLHTNGTVDPILRFFDWNQQYLRWKEQGEWKSILSEFETRSKVTDRILERIFHSEFFRYQCLNAEEKQRFISELFQIYTNQVDTSGVISLGYYFTTQDKFYFWENTNLKQFLLMGPGLSQMRMEGKIAFPLLMDFLDTVEEAIKTRKKSLDLIFAHAETMLPFLTLLQIPELSEQVDRPYQVAIAWKNYQMMPMAANLQWIFYEKREEANQDILVQCKLNEEAIQLPIKTDCYPYYRWNEVCAFYKNVLKELNLPSGKKMADLVRDYQWEECKKL